MKRTIALVLLILLAAAALVGCGEKSESINWDALFLGDYLPKPQSLAGKVETNDDDWLEVELYEMSETDYSAYIVLCREFGYTVDDEKSGDYFTAFNEEGYKIDIVYWGDEEKLTIDVKAPEEMREIIWPNSAIAKYLPIPQSNIGMIEYDQDDFLMIYIGETSPEDYTVYVDACLKAGFNVDYDRGETYFYAENEAGVSLSVNYKGANVICINAEIEATVNATVPTAPEEEKPAETVKNTVPETTEKPKETVPETTEKPKDKDDGKLGKEFKEAMDAYEEFFDEYVAFMKEYKKNPTDLKLLGKYATIMTEYTQMMEEMEDWEDEDLNAAETIYYVEVTQRISKKLLEVAL